jgi:hypothetical protein
MGMGLDQYGRQCLRHAWGRDEDVRRRQLLAALGADLMAFVHNPDRGAADPVSRRGGSLVTTVASQRPKLPEGGGYSHSYGRERATRTLVSHGSH